MLLDQIKPIDINQQPITEHQKSPKRYTKIALQEFKKHQQLFERLKHA